jgi:integrase
MPRHVRDAKLSSREARARLKVQDKPHWRLIEPGLHLGYRRLAGRPGTWCVRRYVGEQTYVVQAISLDGSSVHGNAIADDFQEADGQTVLNFRQAQQAALESKPKAGPLTVQKAVEDYLRHIADRSGTYDAGRRAAAFILPALGREKVEALTTARLRRWHADLAKTPRRKRTAAGEPQQYCKPDHSKEGHRKRQSSANRVLVTLKAALNHAWREGHVPSDIEWRRVKPFPGTVSARVRYLTIQEARRLIKASSSEFRPLVQAALATGCRYGELGRLAVSDFNPTAGTLHIRDSKSGKPRHVVLTQEGIALFRQLAAGRVGADLFFQAPRGGPWLRSCQERPMREACARAKISPPAGFHVLRHTWASLSVMAGMPLVVVAKNLGHANARMVEAHYGHLSQDFIANAIRASAPQFGMLEPTNVEAIR